MAIYREIRPVIWRDRRFRALSSEDKVKTILRIVFRRPSAFEEYAGREYVELTDDERRKKRTDLSSSKWRSLRAEVLQEQGTICAYCHSDCSDDPTVDHVVPVVRGADPFDKENLVVSCRSCNCRKGWRRERP